MKINLNDLMTLIRSGKEEFSLEDIESLTGKELEKKDSLLGKDEIRVSKVFGDVSSDKLFGEPAKPKDKHDDLFSEPKAGLFGEPKADLKGIEPEPAPNEGLFSNPLLDNCYDSYFAKKGYSGEADYFEEFERQRMEFEKQRIEFVKKLKASPEVLQIKREVALVKTLIGFDAHRQTLSTKARLFCLRDYVNDYRLNPYAEKAEKIMDRFTERMGIHNDTRRVVKVIELLNHYHVPKNLQLFAILRTKDFGCLSQSMVDLSVGLYSLLETYGLDGLLSEDILESLIVGDDVAFVEDYIKCRSLTKDCNAVRKFVMEYLDGFAFRNVDHISCLLNRICIEHTFIDSKLVDAEEVYDAVTECSYNYNSILRGLYMKYSEKLLEHSNLVKLNNELNEVVFKAFERL